MAKFTGTNCNDTIIPGTLSNGVTTDTPHSTPSGGTDTIVGYGGNDHLDGGGGADVINGGDGNDAIGAQGTGWLVHGDGGGDEIVLSGHANSTSNPTPATISGAAYGDSGDDRIVVNPWGFGPSVTGTVSLHGGIGNDTIGARLSGPSDETNLDGYSVYAYGDAGNDHLTATFQFTFSNAWPYFAGNNDDHLFGGPGDDSYFVLEQRDVVVEKPNEGHDQIEAWDTDYTLPANVEDLLVSNLSTYNSAHRYSGNELNNVITDGNGNDTIHGDAGNDEIFGLFGDDLIYGDAGNDKLWGQSENDTIYGGDGNDRIGGGSGEDHLYGEAGNDVISGTGGRDWLTGGAGNDRFDYDNVTESAPGAANRDVIADFFGAGAKGGDVIDLSTIDANSGVGGNQAFIFGGTGAGHVHAVASGASDSLIQADIGGAAGPELEFLVTGVAASHWTAGDFIL